MRNEVTLTLNRTAVAHIDSSKCINCGKCREYCPVQAISEKQKAICHLCSSCTEMKAITPEQVIEMQHDACSTHCPVGIQPQGFIGLLKTGKKKEAFEVIWDKNPLPAVCGYICHHPCESACKRGLLVDRPMELRAVQRFLSEEFLDYQPASYPVLHDERIAVIGAGPAGLTAAHWLSKKGYRVTVYEQSSVAGGMLIDGIPEFRLNKEVVQKEIARLEKAGIEIIYDAKLNPADMKELTEKYDRVYFA